MIEEKERLTVPRDGKSGFYRKLNLDKNTMKLIRKYRSVKKLIDREINVRPKEDASEANG